MCASRGLLIAQKSSEEGERAGAGRTDSKSREKTEHRVSSDHSTLRDAQVVLHTKRVLPTLRNAILHLRTRVDNPLIIRSVYVDLSHFIDISCPRREKRRGQEEGVVAVPLLSSSSSSTCIGSISFEIIICMIEMTRIPA
jgi:hypothetical protein